MPQGEKDLSYELIDSATIGWFIGARGHSGRAAAGMRSNTTVAVILPYE